MKERILYLLTILLGNFSCTKAQSVEAHQWRNRVVVVFTEQLDNELFQRQMAEWQQEMEGLAERKIVYYQVTPDAYKYEDQDWVKSTTLFETYFQNTTNFQVLLIGLDGGTKMRKSELVSAAQLFGEIDQMPMRRAEIKNQKE